MRKTSRLVGVFTVFLSLPRLLDPLREEPHHEHIGQQIERHEFPISASGMAIKRNELLTADFSGVVQAHTGPRLELKSRIDTGLSNIAQVAFSDDESLFAISGERRKDASRTEMLVRIFDSVSKEVIGDIGEAENFSWGPSNTLHVWGFYHPRTVDLYEVKKRKIARTQTNKCDISSIYHVVPVTSGFLVSGVQPGKKWAVHLSTKGKSTDLKLRPRKTIFSRTPGQQRIYAYSIDAVYSLDEPNYEPDVVLEAPPEGIERFASLDADHAVVCTKTRMLLFDTRARRVTKEVDLFEAEKKNGVLNPSFRLNRLLTPVGIHVMTQLDRFVYLNMRGDTIIRSSEALSIVQESRVTKFP